MTYEVIILGHLHMPLYFIGTFTEYPFLLLFYLFQEVIQNTLSFLFSFHNNNSPS